MIDDLLRLARIKRPDLQESTFSLADLAKAAVELERDSRPHREVEVKFHADFMDVAGDVGLTRVLMYKLVSNAFKFSDAKEKTVIEVGTTLVRSVDRGGFRRAYFVRDEGVGLGGKLFDPFKRFHRGSQYPGTGMGLAMCRRIVRRHGGEMWMESKEGSGATLFFTLGDPKARPAIPTARRGDGKGHDDLPSEWVAMADDGHPMEDGVTEFGLVADLIPHHPGAPRDRDEPGSGGAGSGN